MNDRPDTAQTVADVSDECAHHLAGLGPEVQSAIIADLFARFLAGTHPNMRDEVFSMMCALVLKLIPPNEHALFGDAGHPGHKEETDVAS